MITVITYLKVKHPAEEKHPDTMLPDRKVSIGLMVISFLQETIHKPLEKKIKENRGKGEERGNVEVPRGRMHILFTCVFLHSKEQKYLFFKKSFLKKGFKFLF